MKIAIIGAGIGGLSAGIRLAHNGYDVHIFEQSNEAGGKAKSINLNGFRFDTGPSLVTMPFVIKDLFDSVNESIEDYLEIKQLDNLCRYFYPDGTVLNAYSNLEKFGDEIESKTKDKSFTLNKYLEYCKTIYDLTSDLFLFSDLYSFSSLLKLKAIKTLFQIGKIDSFRTMNEANRSFFSDEKVIQLFNRYATYNGSNPYKAPATLNIIPHVEYNLGGYYFTGGMFDLTKALLSLAEKKGVKIHYNSVVDKIKLENKKVTGISVKGNQKNFEYVISNADVHNTYSKLLNDNSTKMAKRYSNIEPSTSALVFYLGVKGTYDKIETHNILFSNDYKKEFQDLFEKRVFPDDPTIYIYVSSKFNYLDAPQECENWFVMINTPSVNEELKNNNYELVKQNILQKINLLTGYDIRDKIICETMMTPEDIEKQTGSYRGSIYGISSNTKSAAFMRQRNKSNDYGGLYFCGGSAHPGGGIPLVMLSGKICAEKILSEKSKS